MVVTIGMDSIKTILILLLDMRKESMVGQRKTPKPIPAATHAPLLFERTMTVMLVIKTTSHKIRSLPFTEIRKRYPNGRVAARKAPKTFAPPTVPVTCDSNPWKNPTVHGNNSAYWSKPMADCTPAIISRAFANCIMAELVLKVLLTMR